MELKIFTDGGALNNPGPAASAFLIYQDNKIISQGSKFLGENTNNFAEYNAVIITYEEIIKLLEKQPKIKKNLKKLIFHSDSSLLVNQLNGLFKIKNSIIRELVFKVKGLEGTVNKEIIYKYIPREQNQEADFLVKKCLGRA